MIVGCLILNSCSLDAHQLKSLEHLITKKQAMNTKLNKQQNQLLFEIDFSTTSNEFDFKEWASEVRKQMIASLEQRHTKRAKK